MSFGRGKSLWAWLVCAGRGWPRSPNGISGSEGWLKTSKSSLELETSTIPSSPLVKGWDEVASSSAACWKDSATFGMPSGIGSVVKMPSRIEPVVRKLGTATLIR